MLILLILLSLISFVKPGYYTNSKVENDERTCLGCFTRDYIGCVDSNFQNSYCCRFEHGSEKENACMAPHKYCTINLKTEEYMRITCPMRGCPGTYAYEYTHQVMNVRQNHYKSWNEYEEARYCKMSFTASPELNGKMTLKIESKKSSLITVYKMPRHFNKTEYQYHGIFENGYIFESSQAGDEFIVPTDWIILISYNVARFRGQISLTSWVEPWTAKDRNHIKYLYQPTGTSYVNQTLVEELRLAKEAKLIAEKEALAQQLQDAKDEAERIRIQDEFQKNEILRKKQEKLQLEREALARIKVQEAAKADIKTFSSATIINQNPDGLYLNDQVILLLSVVGLVFLICGGLIVYLIMRKIKLQKQITEETGINDNDVSVMQLNELDKKKRAKRKQANADTLEDRAPEQMKVEIDSVGSIEDPNLFDSPMSKGRRTRNRISKVHPTSDSKNLEDFMVKGNHADDIDDEDWYDVDKQAKASSKGLNVMLTGEEDAPTGFVVSKRKARMIDEEEKEAKEAKEYEEWFRNHPKNLKQSVLDLPDNADVTKQPSYIGDDPMELKKKPIPDDPMHIGRKPSNFGKKGTAGVVDTIESDLPARRFASNHKLTDGNTSGLYNPQDEI